MIRPIRSLVLAGGGFGGAYQAGVIDALATERGQDFEIISGVSIGAIAATYLGAKSQRELSNFRHAADSYVTFWDDVKRNKDFFRQRLFGPMHLLCNRAINNNRPLREKLKAAISEADIAKIDRKVTVGAVDLLSGKYIAAILGKAKLANDGMDEIINFVMGSTSAPILFDPVNATHASIKMKLIDGGTRNVTPIQDALEQHRRVELELKAAQPSDTFEHVMTIVLCQPRTVHPMYAKELKKPFSILGRSLSLQVNEVYRNDIEVVRQSIKMPVTLYEPSMEYVEMFKADPTKIRYAIDMGYKDVIDNAYAKWSI